MVYASRARYLIARKRPSSGANCLLWAVETKLTAPRPLPQYLLLAYFGQRIL